MPAYGIPTEGQPSGSGVTQGPSDEGRTPDHWLNKDPTVRCREKETEEGEKESDVVKKQKTNKKLP